MFRRHWPLIAALVLLWSVIAWLYCTSVGFNGGRFIYSLDDAYIHLDVARNIALHGVWGVTRYEPSSCTSSPLWTLVMTACVAAFGTHDRLPLVVNILLASMAVVVGHRILSRWFPALPRPLGFAVLVLFMFATPLPLLVFAGMEHILHLLLILLFIDCASGYFTGDKCLHPGWQSARLALLTALCTGARYESLFLAALTALLLRIRGRSGTAYAVGFAALVPVIAYGGFSVAQGGGFLPNSVLLKGNMADLKHVSWLVDDLVSAKGGATRKLVVGARPFDVVRLLGFTALETLVHTPSLLVMSVGAVVFLLLSRRGGVSSPPAAVALLILGSILLHGQFARAGEIYMFRYEGYLIGAGTLFILPALLEAGVGLAAGHLPGKGLVRLAAAFLLILAISPLVKRAQVTLETVVPWTRMIYQQQYQMALFLHEFYPGASVAINDIGLVNYLADVRSIDLVGLGTNEVCHERLEVRFDGSRLEGFARERGVQVAVVYANWFPIPPSWTPVGRWTVDQPGYKFTINRTVTFFATQRDQANRLLSALQRFAPRLPHQVQGDLERL